MANYRQTSASAAPSTRYARTCFVSPRGPRARAKELTEPCPGDEAPARTGRGFVTEFRALPTKFSSSLTGRTTQRRLRRSAQLPRCTRPALCRAAADDEVSRASTGHLAMSTAESDHADCCPAGSRGACCDNSALCQGGSKAEAMVLPPNSLSHLWRSAG
jgi:hypothetical protein